MQIHSNDSMQVDTRFKMNRNTKRFINIQLHADQWNKASSGIVVAFGMGGVLEESEGADGATKTYRSDPTTPCYHPRHGRPSYSLNLLVQIY